MNHLRCSFALLAVLASGGVASLPAAAQGTGPGSKPAAPVAIDTRITELLQRARAVMNDVQSMSYAAEVIGVMPDGNRQSIVKSTVVVERGEQEGSWKFFVEGNFAIEAKNGGKRESEMDVKAAYDGAEVAVIDSRRRLLRLQDTKELEVVRVTMNQGSAATSVAWELFGDKPLNGCDVAIKAELESPQTVDGLECDVVWFVPPKAKSASGVVHESAVVPSKIYFAKRDGIPRRFEIYRPAAATLPADKRGEPTRTLTLVGLALKSELSGKSFTIETPDGYKVTDGDGKRRTRSPKSETPAEVKPAEKTPAAPVTPAPSGTPTTYKWPLLPSDRNLMNTGTMAPAFELKDVDGKAVKLSDFAGKTTVMVFWGTWSDQAKNALPAVQRVFAKYQGKGVSFLGLNSESNPTADPRKFLADNGITFPNVLKAETITGNYRVKSWPTVYVFGKDQRLVWGGQQIPTPPGGGSAALEYLESNLGQAIDKALEGK